VSLKPADLDIETCDDLASYLRVTRLGGPLLALAVAARLVKVSRQRVYEKAKKDGVTVWVRGHAHVRLSWLRRWS